MGNTRQKHEQDTAYKASLLFYVIMAIVRFDFPINR